MNPSRKIMPLEACNNVSRLSDSPSAYATGSWHFVPSNARKADLALEKLEEAHSKDLAIHITNLPAIENNSVIRAEIEEYMDAIGMPRSWSEIDYKSRSKHRKYMSVTAGYLNDLRVNVPITDGFSPVRYESLKKSFLEYKQKSLNEEKAVKEAAQQDEERKKAERRANLEMATIILRYKLEEDIDWDGILDALRAKDQRLDLALAMMDCRSDWSDGPDIVDHALGRFTARTAEDHTIEDSLLPLCHDEWDHDGRVFRDCEWNYERILSSIEDKQLVADAMAARGHCD